MRMVRVKKNLVAEKKKTNLDWNSSMTMSMTVTLDHDRDHDRDHTTRHGNVNTRIAIREDAIQHKFRRYAKSLYARMLYSTNSADCEGVNINTRSSKRSIPQNKYQGTIGAGIKMMTHSQICEVAIREDAIQHKFRRYAKSLYARMLYSTNSADMRRR